jgi:hypothetical protein
MMKDRGPGIGTGAAKVAVVRSGVNYHKTSKSVPGLAPRQMREDGDRLWQMTGSGRRFDGGKISVS